ncbi:MAG: CDP-glycerol glycerophosphotransferase family protein [Nitrosarchaeum sp.]|nr:CDP-glycerol glycerophosphotransferase family protein [Nitrosarchaeum sp.]
MTKTILFLPSNGNHVKIFHPIIDAIKKNYDFLFLTQGTYKDEGAENELNRLKIPYKTVDAYPKLDPNMIFEQENIGLLIVGNDFDILPQWFINIAKKKRIPSILIQDGLLLDVIPLNNDVFHQIQFLKTIKSKKLSKLSLKLKLSKQIRKISYGQAGCTQIHVWSDSDKKYLIKKKIPENSIYVIGNVKSFNPKTISHQTQNENSFILYASTDLIQTKILEKKRVIKTVDEICKTITLIPKMKLMIKPHPIEKKQFYDDFEKNYTPVVKVTYEDVSTLISKSIFLITNLSAVTFEALFQKKQVIIYLPELEKIVKCDSFPFDLIKQGIILYAKTPKELLEKIQLLRDNSFNFTSSQIDVINNYLGQMDNPVSKITQSINEIMMLKDTRQQREGADL